jgi:hypothetical protein
MAEQFISLMTAACPHIASCNEVAYCEVAGKEISQIDGVDMRLCTSRHYEVCYVYSNSLRREISGFSFSRSSGNRHSAEAL